MTAQRDDERFERELARFLDWQSRQVGGAPGIEDVAGRIAGRASGAAVIGRRTSRAWVIVAVGILVAAAAGAAIIAGRALLDLDPLTGDCGSTAELTAANESRAAPAGLPADLRVAFVSSAGDEVVVGDGSNAVAVATIREPRGATAISVLDRSVDGSALLVAVGRVSRAAGAACLDLWLVRIDRPEATRIARSDEAGSIETASLGADGQASFVARNRATGEEIVQILDPDDGTIRTLPAMAGHGRVGSIAAVAGGRLLAATAAIGRGDEVTISSYDIRSGALSALAVLGTRDDHEWRLPGPAAFSRDGRRVLVPTVISMPDGSRLPTVHAVDLVTGAATPLGSSERVPATAGWLSNDRAWFITADGELVASPTDGAPAVLLGRVPASSIVWSPEGARR